MVSKTQKTINARIQLNNVTQAWTTTSKFPHAIDILLKTDFHFWFLNTCIHLLLFHPSYKNRKNSFLKKGKIFKSKEVTFNSYVYYPIAFVVDVVVNVSTINRSFLQHVEIDFPILDVLLQSQNVTFWPEPCYDIFQPYIFSYLPSINQFAKRIRCLN